MNNKRGFTLVEVLAIVTVLSLIAMASFPSIIKMIKKNQDSSYNSKITDIILAAQTYNSLNGGKISQIPLSTLIESNYISGDIIDPRDNSIMNGCVYIDNGDYVYKEEACYIINTSSNKLSSAILTNNYVVETSPSLTTTSDAANEKGLYVSTSTNSGNPTYYFRGSVDNNYVSFAGFIWRIVRINEDGTVRLIMQNGIKNKSLDYKINTTANRVDDLYYSNGINDLNAKKELEKWYQENLENYNNYISQGNYFCEQAKVKFSYVYTSGSATMDLYSSYTPTFRCSMDGNEKGVINSKIGLLDCDEVIYAGGYYNLNNTTYYLRNGLSWWTGSPAGINATSDVLGWVVTNSGIISNGRVFNGNPLRPVINLKENVEITGLGTIDNPYVVK